MSLLQYDLLKADIAIQQTFQKPLFAWEDAARRFFATVFEALSPTYSVASKDFSIAPGTTLGEVSSRYNIFGGASSIYLMPDRLVANFLSVGPNDIDVAVDILRLVQGKFSVDFNDVIVKSIEYRWQGHIRVHAVTPSQFFENFQHSSIASSLSAKGMMLDQGLHFRAIQQSPPASIDLTAERSLAFEGGVFLTRGVVLTSAEKYLTFEDKYNAISLLDEYCLEAINLSNGAEGQS